MEANTYTLYTTDKLATTFPAATRNSATFLSPNGLGWAPERALTAHGTTPVKPMNLEHAKAPDRRLHRK